MTEMIQIGFVLMAVVAWFVLVDSFHSNGYGFWAGHDFSILGGWLRERAVRRLGITECGGNDADGYWWRRSNGPDIRLSAEEFSLIRSIVFTSLAHAQVVSETRRREYNEERLKKGSAVPRLIVAS